MKISFRRAVCALLLTACTACSGHKATPAPADNAAPATLKMPTQQEMEAAFKKMSTTTKEHELLKDFVGTWNATTSTWMAPGAAPMVSKGTSVNTLIFGGKFLKQDFSGTWMNKPFKGVGYTGFDTVANEFTSVWLDDMATSILSSKGSYEPSSNTITLTGDESCPFMPSGKMQLRSVTRKIDKNHFVFEMYHPGPDGKDMKGFEIKYSRK